MCEYSYSKEDFHLGVNVIKSREQEERYTGVQVCPAQTLRSDYYHIWTYVL